MAGRTVAFPDVSGPRRFWYSGGQTFDPDQPLTEGSSANTELLIDDPPEERCDEGFDRFERIAEVRAALMEILELVRTVAPMDSTIFRLTVSEEREARVALETAFQ